MKLVLLTLACLLGSSSVFAAERYTEVWNPPEVQSVKGKNKARNATQTASKKKRKSAPPVKQVADKARIDVPSVPAPRGKASSSARPSEPVIPRKIEPNGQVMRV